MRIQCPFCGERDSGEFSYLGAYVRRPTADTPETDTRFFQAVYVRENPAGRHRDLWYHAFGCRSWLVLTRDTRTHEIFAVELANGAANP
jgi:methylglutamate dehydrogenase subunit B